tara:strand:+ start:1390 stop:3291 length:1902 start_codon:yes stop_codon:yes gene_type:complete
MTTKEQIIPLGDKKLLVALDWEESEAKSALSYHFELGRKAKNENKKYGFKNQNFSDDSVYAQHFLTAKKRHFDDGVIVGAGFIAEKVHETSPTLFTTIFISNVKHDEDDILTENEFWFVAISDNGYIFSGDDKLIVGNDELLASIAQYRAISYGVVIYHIDNDEITSNLIASEYQKEVAVSNAVQAREAGEDDDPVKLIVTAINIDSLNIMLEETNAKLKVIYRESPIKIQKIGVGLAIAVAVSAAIGGWRFYEQIPAQQYFSDEISANRIGDAKVRADEGLKQFKKSKNWNDQSYVTDTVESFNDFYLENKLTSEDVGNVMFYIERTLPLYAVEWQMSSITMNEGQFYVTYERIANSKGTFVILDAFINELNKQVEYYDIAAIAVNPDPDVRTFRVIPRIHVGLSGEAESLDSQRRAIKAYKAQKKKQLEAIEDLSSDWTNLDYQFDNLPPLSRYLLNEGSSLMEEAKLIDSKLKGEEDKLNQLLKLEYNKVSERINPAWVNARTSDFIILMQTDSLFSWDMPKISRTFPSQKEIEENNYKPKKKKKSSATIKGVKAFGAAINALSVKISTNESEDEGAVRSYGILDLKHLMRLVNVPSIQIESVSYSKTDEQWTVTLRFYEKTSEFEKHLM